MPNHVCTRMSIEGTDDEVKNFFNTHFTDDELDFNTFIKMPEELQGTRSPVQEPDSFENRRLRKAYGADNWYDWSTKNWGTKWNSYDNHIDHSDNRVSFQTAWSLPDPIFQKMAEMYPSMTFNIETVEEGGYFSGTILISEGAVKENLTADEDTWKQYALDIMGWNFDED